MGIDESNPAFVWSVKSKPEAGAVDAARKKLSALHPTYYRLRVNWDVVQPVPGAEPDWSARRPGCHGEQPCLPYRGVLEQLEAVRSEQQDHPGTFQVVVLISDAPAWATGPPPGCVDSASTSPTHLRAYRRLVASLVRVARQVGVELPWWSAWDEPNHAGFLSPQTCGGQLVSAEVYAGLVRALRRQLAAAPGEQRVLLGDTAAIPRSTAEATSPADFIAALPGDVACDSNVWAQHGYVVPGRAPDIGRDDATLERVLAALDAQVCDRRKLLWITETGAGAGHAGEDRGTSEQDLGQQCDAMAHALQSWYESARVDAAFQYTFREDPAFQVGLVSADLGTTYPTYDLWRAWSTRAPHAPAPNDSPCP